MSSVKREHAIEFMKRNNFAAALQLFEELMIEKPEAIDADMYYMIGQCNRFLENYSNAIYCLKKSLENDVYNPDYLLALGIAYQLDEKYEESEETFKVLIPNNQEWNGLDLAFNSLALTLKKMGQFDRALKNYKQAILFESHKVIEQFISEQKVLEEQEIYITTHNLWRQYFLEAVMLRRELFSPEVEQIVIPIKGLICLHKVFWEVDENNALILYTSFFAKAQKILCSKSLFSILIGNIGMVLEAQNEHEEAQKHFDEANELKVIYERFIENRE